MLKKFRTVGAFGLGTITEVMISIGLAAVAVEATKLPFPVEQLRRLAEVFNAVRQGFVDPVDDNRLVDECLRGMLAATDSDSAYLDQGALADLQVGPKEEFQASLGVELAKVGDGLKVVSPIDGTLAYRGGVNSGDLIIRINGRDVKGIDLAQGVKLLHGKVGSEVVLTLLRVGEDEPRNVVLRREIIKAVSVKSKWLEPGYAYVRLSQFLADSATTMTKQLKELSRQRPIEGLVLDLRKNPGGLLSTGIAISAAFLQPDSVIASMVGRQTDANRVYRASMQDYGGSSDDLKGLPPEMKTVPMVVLVDSGSAAASEIVAGALQDHRRAKILGSPTFGKASVQTFLPIGADAAIKLTTARWVTPNGHSISGQGITPDIVVPSPSDKSSSGDTLPLQAVAMLKSAGK